MTTILSDAGTFELSNANAPWLSAEDAARVTGWTLKPEGMCRDDTCIPLPATALRGGTVDVAALWERLGAPVLHAEARDAWVLGASADARNALLAGANAPDFTLPDLEGRPHTLSSLHGRKVFLATWASW